MTRFLASFWPGRAARSAGPTKRLLNLPYCDIFAALGRAGGAGSRKCRQKSGPETGQILVKWVSGGKNFPQQLGLFRPGPFGPGRCVPREVVIWAKNTGCFVQNCTENLDFQNGRFSVIFRVLAKNRQKSALLRNSFWSFFWSHEVVFSRFPGQGLEARGPGSKGGGGSRNIQTSHLTTSARRAKSTEKFRAAPSREKFVH